MLQGSRSRWPVADPTSFFPPSATSADVRIAGPAQRWLRHARPRMSGRGRDVSGSEGSIAPSPPIMCDIIHEHAGHYAISETVAGQARARIHATLLPGLVNPLLSH